ncbi:MAG: hypothetical protein COV10_04135 [Candidatus Vogelbacteria bacterium CG10_big_fil_rev_8_21_14_0_10_51_16]|uniref:Uncharacterized protein n=1 Tax=Candidatus Vogelbacteria bacterium CG10_big_fil_rev_8_21_14_0_10_51_16 TaxID=1975045 RepID=A0A2H0RDB5_9BACT|nr:MAG: hypothetical protein COV10_04135 [Candidatus Vogelbacteria bacterium CG10_big_fil_rev_8_21_14_0_10_51_16]
MTDMPATNESEGRISRGELIEVLRTQGFNRDTQEAVRAWAAGRIAEIEAIPNDEPEQYKREGIIFNTECSLVYLAGEAQDLKETIREIEGAGDQAMQEGFMWLASQIVTIIEKVEGGERDVDRLMELFR